MNGAVLIRCDGSPEIGQGHVARCLALARELRDAHACGVVFAMRQGPLGMEIVREAGFRVLEAQHDGRVDYRQWMSEAARESAADTIVLDVRDNLTLDDVRAIRRRTRARIVVLDDASERRLAGDEAFYPPVPQVRALSWAGFEGHVHVGWEWMPMRPEFAGDPHPVRHETPRVLVTMGGTDPAGLTEKAVRALALVERPMECVVLLGRGFTHDASLALALDGLQHGCEVVRDGDVRSHMLNVDLAVLSFGGTAYEAAACALPAVHLCLTDDHALASSAFADHGIAVSLGVAEDVQPTGLAAAIVGLLADPQRRSTMGERARRLVDGKGAARMAEVIAGGRLD